MRYPYLLMNPGAKAAPMVKLTGQPLLIVLDKELAESALALDEDSVAINNLFSKIIADAGCGWALGPYLENRESIMSQYPQMRGEARYFHLGVDICAPAGTPVYAPLDCRVHESGYEEGAGNYGGYVILKHEPDSGEPFYIMIGHMKRSTLPLAGDFIKSGEKVAEIGDLGENGGWNHHTHIQIITEKGRQAGYFFRGYCSLKMLPEIDLLCPSPMPLLAAGAVIC